MTATSRPMPGCTRAAGPPTVDSEVLAAGRSDTRDGVWEAVLARDARRDGTFVYAVRTTRVYCCPSCPSRRPRPEHVAFYDGPDAAEAAGFRACRRCHPRADRSVVPAAVERARAYLDAHLAAGAAPPVPLAALAAVAGLSPSHLQRTFKRALGVSPRQYVAARRADHFKAELRRGTTVSRATFEAGYSGGNRAYAAADAHLGMTPAAYRRGGAGVAIRYATAPTVVGRVLVAATARGVCAVLIGDDDVRLERALAEEYPRATRTPVPDPDRVGDADLQGWLDAVTAHLAGDVERPSLDETSRALDLPTDSPGTPLQERVWAELRRIPYGETRTYAEVAAAAGAPRAVRAVASACARNRVALVIPCHRVVRAGGAGGSSHDGAPAEARVGGYRWGVDRKCDLLRKEHAVVARRVDARADGQ